MTEIIYYDLDGTLSKLNSTFDFIFPYLKRHYLFRYFIGKVTNKVINLFTLIPYYKRRRLIIKILYNGLTNNELTNYYKKHYKKRFMNNLSKLGEKLVKNKKKEGILLTGCIEIPAKDIAKIFGFQKVISTELKFTNGRIKGISKDTFGDLKANYIKSEKGKKLIYYTDDLHNERKLEKVMHKIVVV